MSDDVIDDQLRGAGERWRAANADAAVEDGRAHQLDGPRFTRRKWVAAASGFAVAAAVVTGVVLAGHDAPSEARPGSTSVGELVGTWTIVAVRDPKGDDVSPSSGASFKVERAPAPKDWSITGSDGVNSFQGAVTVRGGRVDFADLAISAVGATAPNAATTIDAILAGRATWSITGNQLTLSNAAGTIVARPQAVPRAAALAGTRWELMTIEVGNAASPPTSPAYLMLAASGAIGWSDGCNDLTGIVSTVGHALTIRPDSQPNIGCGGNAVQAQPATLASVLTGRVSWSIDGDQLALTKGRTTLVYMADVDPGFTGASPGQTQASATSTK